MASSKGRILYSEDDPDARELMRFVFARYGYDIVCADTGPAALELAKLERFDLFLVDNWMPDLTGVELTEHIRAFNKTTPILFYSGVAHKEAIQAALAAGAQGYITKPADVDELIAEAEKLLSRTI